MEDGQHVGEQGAIAPCSNANAAPIGESNLDRRVVKPGRAINDGYREKGGSGERLRGNCLATTVAFGNGPSPAVEGMFAQAMTLAVITDAEPARTLLIEVTTPTLLALDADLSRHRGLR
jgi:hypothetical protein